jgi:two-component system, OmpR family, response regulator
MNKKATHILIVDDDAQLRHLLGDFLSQHHFEVKTAENGEAMKLAMTEQNFDLIILDLMMPGDDGLTLCQFIRKTSSVPIIMLSAVAEETDRVVGFEVGADDYLPKPFSPRELLARVKARLRRSHSIKSIKPNTLPHFLFNKWELDPNKRKLISPEGLTIPVTGGEFDLLLIFLKHPKQTLSRDQLLDLTRGREASPLDRTIDVQIGRLRKKIESSAKTPKIILTVRNGGYQFNSNVELAE